MFSLRCLAAERRLQAAAGRRRAGKKEERGKREGRLYHESSERGREGKNEGGCDGEEGKGGKAQLRLWEHSHHRLHKLP